LTIQTISHGVFSGAIIRVDEKLPRVLNIDGLLEAASMYRQREARFEEVGLSEIV
jgi:hypothetical protein